MDRLPEGWRMVKFGDVVREVSLHERNPLENGLERFIGLDNFDPGSLRIKRWNSIADGTSFTKKFERGQVLFPKRRVYQRKIAVADFSGICSSDIIVMETKTAQMIPEFLPYLVQSDAFFDWAEATSSGSLSPRTKFKHLAEFQFPLPPIERQRELVEVFDALEATIRCNEEAIESAENLKKSLMTELLTRGIGHTRFKQTEIGKIPVGWKVFLFSDAIDVNPKRPISRGETATFVSMMDITEHVRQITNSTEKPFKGGGAKFRNGDTLLARITPCLENGKTAYVDILDANEVASGSTEFIVLSGKKNIMLNEYVYYVAISPTFREDAIHSMIGTTGRYRVPNDFFNRFWIGVPSLSEQQKIVQTLRAVEAEIDVHQNYREKLRDLKREVNTDLTSMKSTDL